MYTPPISLQDNSFDFGFDQNTAFETSSSESASVEPNLDYMQESFVIAPEDLQDTLTTPRGSMHPPMHHTAPSTSPEAPPQAYTDVRRPSLADELMRSHHMADMAAAASEAYGSTTCQPETTYAPVNGPLDIAARRKRPRPAALTSLSLRSRSYGAMTSVSPTFRQNILSPQGPHSVRHVKSAGQSLHSRYAGIRKASSAQRSPMCATTFAEAEAFNQLMTEQAIINTPLEELPEPVFGHPPQTYATEADNGPYFASSATEHRLRSDHNLSVTTASPPITPVMASYLNRRPAFQNLMPPTSAPPQFATFPDYTPPYSAGPMTNSSWSDAPLTSPELPAFPASYGSSLAFPQQEEFASQFENFILRSDKSELNLDTMYDENKTEFLLTEFPNQKKEHASIAQQFTQQKPKNYVFANTAPQDYTAI
jgi:hypothetical protein